MALVNSLKFEVTVMHKRGPGEGVEKTGGTREWTETETQELLTKGKVKGYHGHHIKSVKGNEHLAGNPDNIRFVTPKEHLQIYHRGNWKNPSNGDLLSRKL